MKGKKLRISLAIILVLGFAFGMVDIGYAADTQVILDFDELSGIALLPSDYAGLSWQSGWFYNSYTTGNVNYRPHSIPAMISFVGQSYSTGPSAWIDFSPLGTDVTFEGAWFGGHSGTGDIWFEGWCDGVHVATSSHLNINSSNEYTSTYLAADFGTKVDKVYVFVTSEYLVNQFCMDDLTFIIPGDIPVDIDIMPNDINEVNLKTKGLLPVGILGSSEFDVSTIDPATVAIGEVGIMIRGNKLQFGYEDVNFDGYMDMVCKFNIPDLITFGELDEFTTELNITGELIDDGGSFIGCDEVIVLLK